MISFSGYLLDITNNAVLEETFTIGTYLGPVQVVDYPSTQFNGTFQNISVNTANNMARTIERYVKSVHALKGTWPIIRIFNRAPSDYYFEWRHSVPDSLSLITPKRRVVWEHALHFDENYAYDSFIHSYTWCTLTTISELRDYTGSAQFGAVDFHGVPSSQLVSTTPGTFYVSNISIEYINLDDYTVDNGDNIGGYLLGATLQEFYKVSPTIKHYFGFATNIERSEGPGQRPGINKRIGLGVLSPGLKALTNFTIQVKSGSTVIATAFSDGTVADITYVNGKSWNKYYYFRFSSNTTRDEITAWNFHVPYKDYPYSAEPLEEFIASRNFDYDTYTLDIYEILTAAPGSGEPESDVDPDDPDKPSPPIQPDNPDPYYDPTSDPDNPEYDPTKDPESPDYDPSTPHTPYRPPSTDGGGNPPVQQPQAQVPVPDIPPAFVTNNSMFTLYNPSAGDLNSLANFLWSPQWSIDTFKKIFANPLDCILGLMVMPHLSAPTSTKEMAVGNIATGVTMRYFTNQFYDFDCGTFKIEEFYASYLDYAPYTKVNIFLPYIGDQQLDTDEVMNKTIGVKYRFDIATGDCVAFISVDGDVLYSYSGNCASRLPLSGNNWSGMLPAFTGALVAAGSMAAGVPALGAGAALAVTSMKQNISHTGSMAGSPGLMGIQTPYLIITRPRQALPIGQNSFTGYPSFMTESLGSLSGYTEVEACHLEHVPCTAEELEEIERLLKEGVLF